MSPRSKRKTKHKFSIFDFILGTILYTLIVSFIIAISNVFISNVENAVLNTAVAITGITIGIYIYASLKITRFTALIIIIVLSILLYLKLILLDPLLK